MIRIHNVSMQYELGEASVHVLDEVNLAVARGERVAITGPSALLQHRIRLRQPGARRAPSPAPPARVSGRSVTFGRLNYAMGADSYFPWD